MTIKLFALLPLLALAACDDMPRARTKYEIASIAGDITNPKISDLRAEMDALSMRVVFLEKERDRNLVEIAYLKSSMKNNDDWAEENIQRLFCNQGHSASCRSMDSNAAN